MFATLFVCGASVLTSCSSDDDGNSAAALAENYDQNKPFGFCCMSSRTDATSTYNITGGGCYTYPVPEGVTGVVVLTSNGQDMKSTIEAALKNNENKVIIFDGSKGDFIVSSSIKVTVSDKTLLGINQARLCTQWFLTDEIKKGLERCRSAEHEFQRRRGRTGQRHRREGGSRIQHPQDHYRDDRR